MPLILRITVLASCCIGTALLVFTTLEIGVFRVRDEALSGRQIWTEYYGPFFAAAGLILLMTGLGLFKGQRWARWPVVLIYLTASPIELIYSQHHPLQLTRLASNFLVPAILWAAFFYWYLFRKQKSFFSDS